MFVGRQSAGRSEKSTTVYMKTHVTPAQSVDYYHCDGNHNHHCDNKYHDHDWCNNGSCFSSIQSPYIHVPSTCCP